MTGNRTRVACAVLTLVLLLGCFIFPNPTDTSASATETHYLYQDMNGLTQGQINIMKRARQMLEVKWTPMSDIYAWRTPAGFKAGTTYTGVPYGQPVNNSGYIGYPTSLDGFLDSFSDANSKMYTSVGSYNGALAPFYSTDCSGFVSYALGLKNRHTTWTFASDTAFYALSEQSFEALQVGDILNDYDSHVMLVGGIVRDASGKVIALETMEQTPNIAVHTVWRENTGDPYNWHTLKYLRDNYINAGYVMMRYRYRDDVAYTHSCAAPIDGDFCANCKDPAPVAVTKNETGCKSITLSSSGGTIFYTLDGSTPTTASQRYNTGDSIRVTGSAQLRAIAFGGPRGTSRVLTYNVTVPKTSTPGYSAGIGYVKGDTATKGTTIVLSSLSTGAKIYYTTDDTAPTEESIPYSSPIQITDGITIRAIAVAPGCTPSTEMKVTLKVSPLSYSDVKDGVWYTNAIEYVTARGLFAGTGDGNFSPDMKMNRAMFVTVLSRLAGIDKTYTGTIGIFTGNSVNVRSGPGLGYSILRAGNKYDVAQVNGQVNGWYKVRFGTTEGYVSADYFKAYNNEFNDIPKNTWYTIAVQWAYLMGITAGTGDGGFSPEAYITRQDMCCLLSRYASISGITIPGTSTGKFGDDSEISGYAKDAVYQMKNAGIVNGVGDGTFVPKADATRAQVAQIFTVFCQKVNR